MRLFWLLFCLLTPALAMAEEPPEDEEGDEATAEGDDATAEGDDDDSAADDDDSDPFVTEVLEALKEAEAARMAAEARAAERDAELEALQKTVKKLDRKVNPPRPKVRIPTLEVQLGGRISTDLRFRVKEVRSGDWFDSRVLPVGISRQENIAKATLDASISKFRGYVELDFVLTGRQDPLDGLSALSAQDQVVVTRFESQGAFLQARDLLVKGLDFQAGHMLLQWGSGDQFNPTNNFNANDLEDPLLFGQQQANLMFKVDYTLMNAVTFSGVLVPLFRPALTPRSGALALAAVNRLPFVDEDLRHRIHSSNALATKTGTPTVVSEIDIQEPEMTPENMQFGFRVAATAGLQDLALSYYNGRSDFPIANLNHNTIDRTEICRFDPPAPLPRDNDENGDPIVLPGDECVSGLVNSYNRLYYPKVQVVGFNAAGEIPGIEVGYRLELGIYIPESVSTPIYKPVVALDPTPGPQFDYDGDGAAGGPIPETSTAWVFPKWSLGLDRKVGPVMFNVMWVHGLADEFGAGDWATKDPSINTGDDDYAKHDGWVVRDGGVIDEIFTEAALLPADGHPSLFDCATTDVATAKRCTKETLRPRLGDYLVFGFDINFLRDKGLFRFFSLWDLSGYAMTSYDASSGDRVVTHYNLFTPEGFSATLLPEFQFNFGNGFDVTAGALLPLGKPYTKFGDPASGGMQVYMKAKYSF
jgi:hypothetical protein